MFTFNAATSGTYTIETAGNTDCFISLYGPANPNTLIAQDVIAARVPTPESWRSCIGEYLFR